MIFIFWYNVLWYNTFENILDSCSQYSKNKELVSYPVNSCSLQGFLEVIRFWEYITCLGNENGTYSIYIYIGCYVMGMLCVRCLYVP